MTTAELAAIERNLASLRYEQAYGWAADQHLAAQPKGTTYEIRWSSADGYAVFDGVVTHNHPWPSFPAPGLEDLQFAQRHCLRQMRVVQASPFQWHKVRHSVASRVSNFWQPLTHDLFVEVVTGAFQARRIPYSVNAAGVQPREFIRASLDAYDEALGRLGKQIGFMYQFWTD